MRRLPASDSSLNATDVGRRIRRFRRTGLDFSSRATSRLPNEQVSTIIDEERRNLWLGDALNTLNPRELRIIRERRLAEDGATLESARHGRWEFPKGAGCDRLENRALGKKLRAVLTSQTPRSPSL